MPPKTSATSKQLRGTTRKDRANAPAAHERLSDIPEPPASLSTAAKAEWRGLAPLLVAAGTLTDADLRALALLADTLASATGFAETIASEGATVPAAGGGTKGHPALQALATARAQARALLSDFGLTPRSRGAVDPAPIGKGAEDPYAEFKS